MNQYSYSTSTIQRSQSARETALCALALLLAWLPVACGSNSDAGFSDSSAGGALPASRAGSSSAGSGNAMGGAMSIPGTAGAAQSGSGNAAGSGAVCSSNDACTNCVCTKCPGEVSTCESTPGCQAIAECVASSRCAGAACYCGSADSVACATGSANGPCRDAILNAPGGRKPTLTNQSAGPAADAATALGNCGASSSSGCIAICQ